MTTRHVLFLGGGIGLTVCGAVLVLLWYGVAGVLVSGKTNFMHLFWPSSVMLTVGWCRTLPGLMITISSVAINGLLYMAVAYSLRVLVRVFVRS
jgi:hypothetical protein